MKQYIKTFSEVTIDKIESKVNDFLNANKEASFQQFELIANGTGFIFIGYVIENS